MLRRVFHVEHPRCGFPLGYLHDPSDPDWSRCSLRLGDSVPVFHVEHARKRFHVERSVRG